MTKAQMKKKFEAWWTGPEMEYIVQRWEDKGDYFGATHDAWLGWQAALESLPRMTEEELLHFMRKTSSEGPIMGTMVRLRDALVSKFPHIVKEK